MLVPHSAPPSLSELMLVNTDPDTFKFAAFNAPPKDEELICVSCQECDMTAHTYHIYTYLREDTVCYWDACTTCENVWISVHHSLLQDLSSLCWQMRLIKQETADWQKVLPFCMIKLEDVTFEILTLNKDREPLNTETKTVYVISRQLTHRNIIEICRQKAHQKGYTKRSRCCWWSHRSCYWCWWSLTYIRMTHVTCTYRHIPLPDSPLMFPPIRVTDDPVRL